MGTTAEGHTSQSIHTSGAFERDSGMVGEGMVVVVDFWGFRPSFQFTSVDGFLLM